VVKVKKAAPALTLTSGYESVKKQPISASLNPEKLKKFI
jgi:hypothetical protein